MVEGARPLGIGSANSVYCPLISVFWSNAKHKVIYPRNIRRPDIFQGGSQQPAVSKIPFFRADKLAD
jgi:hypothetical protein